jgi:hypothetical protein
MKDESRQGDPSESQQSQPGANRMRKHEVRKSIITVQLVGLALVILVNWLDDWFDLPALFGTTIVAVVFVQTVITTVICVALAIWLTIHTSRVVKRLTQVEGLLPVCSFCKRIRVENKWIPIERYVSERSEATFSHGFCPECGEKYYGEYLKSGEGRN